MIEKLKKLFSKNKAGDDPEVVPIHIEGFLTMKTVTLQEKIYSNPKEYMIKMGCEKPRLLNIETSYLTTFSDGTESITQGSTVEVARDGTHVIEYSQEPSGIKTTVTTRDVKYKED